MSFWKVKPLTQKQQTKCSVSLSVSFTGHCMLHFPYRTSDEFLESLK